MPLPGDAPILATKLYVPPPRENIVSRARLWDRLVAARGAVALIAAASGSGKSTLLADWAQEAEGGWRGCRSTRPTSRSSSAGRKGGRSGCRWPQSR